MGLHRLLFQLHLWIGLVLGVFFALISLSGSLLMLGPVTGLDTGKPAVRVPVAGPPLSLEELVARARRAAGAPSGLAAELTLPEAPDRPATVHFGGWNSPYPNVLLDPATGREVARYAQRMHPALAVLSDLHSRLFLARPGRIAVGWLGVLMLGLGLSGLYLWWPGKTRWRQAFLVSGKARGLRLHRELHGAVGIWSLLLFLTITLTGVGMVFHQSARATLAAVSFSPNTPERDTSLIPDVPAGLKMMSGWQALALAEGGQARINPTSVTLPVRAGQAIKVQLGDWTGRTVFVDPYRAALVENPQPPSRVDELFMAMVTLHVGHGWGPLYWLLAFVTGFLPLLFFITGFFMWRTKRQNRLSMSRPLPQTPWQAPSARR